MATKKQRSRRAKTFRHDYALVKYDEEGNEIEVSASELKGKSPDEKEPTKAEKATAKPASRRGGPPPKPSWERALKRGGIMGLGIAVLFGALLHGPIVIAVVYGVAFIPLTYWSEKLAYRMYERRQTAAAKKPAAAPGAPGSRGIKKR